MKKALYKTELMNVFWTENRIWLQYVRVLFDK